MAYSYEDFTGDGATVNYAVNNPFINRTHVTLLVDGVSVSFTWVSDALITADAAPAADTAVRVKRTTPITTALVNYVNGSTLDADAELDLTSTQMLYAAQEAIDAGNDRLGVVAGQTYWDAESQRITLMADPTSAQDAVTKAYADAIAAASGSVPTPDNPSDNGNILVASGGTFAWAEQPPVITSGMKLTYVSADDLTVGTGLMTADDGATVLSVTSTITKGIKGAWVAGTAQDGLDTGSTPVNSALYAVWAIADKSVSTVADILFSESFTAPTMPTNYDTKRLIGAILTTSAGDIIEFAQADNYFHLVGETPTELNDSTIAHTVEETAAIRVPPNCLAHIYGRVVNLTEVYDHMSIGIVRGGDASNSITDPTASWLRAQNDTVIMQELGSSGVVMVNASSEVDYVTAEGAGTANFKIALIGFTMLTRNEI